MAPDARHTPMVVLRNYEQFRGTQHDRLIDRLIAAIAGPQHGLITTRQLLGLGLTKDDIAYRARIGRLHRLHRGVYAVGHIPVSPYAHALAAVLACGDGAALSHGSAATLWGIDKHWHRPLEVTARSARRHPAITIHRSSTLTTPDIATHFGVPVTSPARTLLDLTPRLTDTRLTRAVNDLRQARYLSLADLQELLQRHRGAKRLRAHTAHPERPPTRSELEDAFIHFANRHDLPEPLINTDVVGREADVFFPEHKLVVELDGYDFHHTREQFESDRDRDAARLAAGVATVRLTWERMHLSPDREAARLEQILTSRRSWR